jgi:hypothetical protein
MPPQIDPDKAASQAEKCRPINWLLGARNALLVFSGAAVLATNLMAYERLTQEFLRMQDAVHAPPCGVATPSSRSLLYGLGKIGFSWNPLLVPKTEEVAAGKVSAAICESSNVYMAISSILDNSTMIHAADANSAPVTYNDAENDLVENLCQRRDPEKDIYGEIRQRIATAYVLSNPAFRRYYHTGCMGNNDPFPTADGTCFYSPSVLQFELYSATYDTVMSGYGVLPPTGHMLYRLLALSAIAETDRRQNNNFCFGNTLVKNATELCQEIYGVSTGVISTSPPPAAPLNLGSEVIPGYEAVAHSLSACNSLYAPVGAASPPPPPPFPNWNFVDPFTQGMGAVDPVIDACRNIHSFGHFDQQSAFGIPDIVHPFSWKPAHWDWPGGWFYYALSYEKMQGIATLENNPINALKLHNAYRLAVSGTMLILTGVCCGYWIAFGGVPLVALVLIRVGEVQSTVTGNYDTLLAPTLGLGGLIATFATLGIWAYSAIIDPWLPAARSYTIDPSCADWHKSSIHSVFVTSDYGSGSWEFLAGYLFPVMPIYAFVYSSACRSLGVPREEWRRQAAVVSRIPALELLLVFFQLASILCFAAIAIEDGDLWFDKTIRKRPDSHSIAKADAQVLIEDLNAAALVAILAGAACGIMRQRWPISQLGYRFHFLWFAAIVLCIVMPFLVYTLEFWNNTARTPRNVSYALHAIFAGGSLFFATKSYFVLRRVPGGKPNDTKITTNTNQVQKSTPSSLRAFLTRKRQVKVADEATAKQEAAGGNPFRGAYGVDYENPGARFASSADADAVSSLPLLGLKLELGKESR